MDEIPSRMRAVVLKDYDGGADSMSVQEIPVPQPGAGEVLIRIAAAPVNPSDLMFMRGMYGFKKPLPAIPGFEGSGTVVAAGAGMMSRFLPGRRVACAAADAGVAGGTWAEYLVTKAEMCVPLRKEVDLEQAANLLVNPLTAWGLMEEAERGGHSAIVQTAAASALGRMVVRLGRRFGRRTINIVRRAEQMALLRDLGAEYVLNEREVGFDEQLRELCHALGATIGFDAVAGEMSNRVLRAQPPGSRLLVYGGLSMEPSRADVAALIFERKRLEGFWLSSWFGGKNVVEKLRIARKVQRLLDSDLKTEIQARLPLEDVARGVDRYMSGMTRGKILLVP